MSERQPLGLTELANAMVMLDLLVDLFERYVEPKDPRIKDALQAMLEARGAFPCWTFDKYDSYLSVPYELPKQGPLTMRKTFPTDMPVLVKDIEVVTKPARAPIRVAAGALPKFAAKAHGALLTDCWFVCPPRDELWIEVQNNGPEPADPVTVEDVIVRGYVLGKR